MSKKKRFILLSTIGFLVGILFLGGAYAFIVKNYVGESEMELIAKNIIMTLNDDTSESILLENAYPVHDSIGVAGTPYTFIVENTGELSADFTVSLKNLPLVDETLRMPQNVMKYQLISSELNLSEIKKLPPKMGDEHFLYQGTIDPGKTFHFTLRLWIASDATSVVENKIFSSKLHINATKEMPLTLMDVAEDSVFDTCRTVTSGDFTYIKGKCAASYVWYSGKLWMIYAKNNITGNYRMVTEEAVVSLAYNAQEKEGRYGFRFGDSYAREWLNREFLPTLVDYESLISPFSKWNYTENSATKLPCYYCNTDYVGLLSYSEILTMGATALFTDDFSTTSYVLNNNGTQNVFGKVFGGTGRNLVDALDCDNLNISFCLTERGKKYYRSFSGLRPVIEMYPSTRIASGTGVKTEPYQVQNNINDRPATASQLLNTRQSGEYIQFMDRTFRIVGVENGLTKITDLSYPIVSFFDLSDTCYQKTDGSSFSFSGCHTNFTQASLGAKLEEYYQAIASPYKEMIEPNTNWYTGKIIGKNNDYREMHYMNSRCQSWTENDTLLNCTTPLIPSKSNLGLPVYGEMFTSYNGAGMWFATGMEVFPDGYEEFQNYTLGFFSGMVRAFPIHAADQTGEPLPTGFLTYLKSNVRISANNTGNGTYEHPFQIEGGV